MLQGRKLAKVLLSAVIMISGSASLLAATMDAEAPTVWNPRVTVASGIFAIADQHSGLNNQYILTWGYPQGSVYMFRSPDNGTTWAAMDVFGRQIWGAWPGMCGYRDGNNDVLIVASTDGMAISRNSGGSYQPLSPLPAVGEWTSMSVGTNASWFRWAPDNAIYVAGVVERFDYPGFYFIGFTKSTDGGLTWSEVVYPTDYSASSSYWPNLVFDGSRMCVVYSVLNNVGPFGQEDFDLHVRYSDDLGATWSQDYMLVDAPTGEHLVSWKMQYAGGDEAIMTYLHQVYDAGSTLLSASVDYGIFRLSNLNYTSYGVYSNGGRIDYGVSGVLQTDGVFAISYVQSTSVGHLYYVTSNSTGLGFQTFPPAPPSVRHPVVDVETERIEDLTVRFDASGSYALDGKTITSYSWTFGDGAVATGAKVEHTYAASGTYEATLLVTDSDGLNSSWSDWVSVTQIWLSLARYEHPDGFALPLPTSWSRMVNETIGDLYVQVVAMGPIVNGFQTNILVTTDTDSTAKETEEYLRAQVNDTIQGFLDDGDSVTLTEQASIMTLSNHTAVVFGIRWNLENISQKMALVVSEEHERFWMIVFTADSSAYLDYNASFDRIIEGFEITLEEPDGGATIASESWLWIGLAIAAATVAIVLLAVWASRRSKGAAIVAPPQVEAASVQHMDPRDAAGRFVCPRCGVISPAGAMFCSNCGYRAML